MLWPFSFLLKHFIIFLFIRICSVTAQELKGRVFKMSNQLIKYIINDKCNLLNNLTGQTCYQKDSVSISSPPPPLLSISEPPGVSPLLIQPWSELVETLNCQYILQCGKIPAENSGALIEPPGILRQLLMHCRRKTCLYILPLNILWMQSISIS